MDEKERHTATEHAVDDATSVVWATAIRVAALALGVAVVLAAFLIPP